MKILTFKRAVGLAAIGGLAYMHKQRGGEWTLDSVKGTLRELWSSASAKLRQGKEELGETLDRAAQASEGATRGATAGQPRAYGYGRRDDDNTRH